MMAEEILITKIDQMFIDDMLKLQKQAIENGNDIMPSSKEVYLRAFQFQNFVYGLKKCDTNELLGFCNCSVPTRNAKINLGRNRVPDNELDFVGHINTIIIDKNFTGHGYGKQIIQKVLDEFKSQNITHIFTIVSPQNMRSEKLFSHFGFSVIETIAYDGNDRNILKLKEDYYEN